MTAHARPTTQAVILARGLGTRMRRAEAGALTPAQAHAADLGIKGLIPTGRPFLDYVLSTLADAGITDVTLVIGPEHRAVRDYFRATAPPARVRVHFAVQAEALGTANAVLAVAGTIEDAPFLVLNADNYYPAEACGALAEVAGAGLVAFEEAALVREGNFDAARVLEYALLDVDDAGWLRAIREKPAPDDPLAQGAERWVSMNLWSFTRGIFEACRRVRPSARGELELADAVTIGMRELGERFRVVRSRSGVLDLSTRADVATVTARLAGVEARP